MWRFTWLDRPSAKVVQFLKDNEVCGSISIDKEDTDSIILWQRLGHTLANEQMKSNETITRIN